MGELLVIDLSGRHLGTTVAVQSGGRLIVGTLTSVDHGSWAPDQAYLRLDVDGLRWAGRVDNDCDVSADHLPEATT